MAIFNWDKRQPDGSYINLAQIFDANGVEFTHVLECDTETGRILRCKLNENGKPFARNGKLVTLEFIHPRPLKVIFID